MAKPTRLFGWISSGSTVTHPDATARTLGFPAGYHLPASWLNDNWQILTEWIDGWLNVLDVQELIWLARHRFDEGIQLGASLVADITDALTERIDMLIAPVSESDRTLLWTIRLAGGGSAIRFWAHNPADAAKGLEITINAVWTGTWAKDDNSKSAMILALEQDPAFVRVGIKPADEDTAWAHTYGTSGGWHYLVAQFAAAGYGYAPIIAGVLGLESAVIAGALAAGATTVTTLTASGAFDAATGADRAEHRAYLDSYAGGAGTEPLVFNSQSGLDTNIQRRLYRIGNGNVTAIAAWIGIIDGDADVTIEVFKVTPGAVTTVLGSVVVAAGLHHNIAILTTGNSYTVFDYLGLRISTAGGASISAIDVGAMIRTVE